MLLEVISTLCSSLPLYVFAVSFLLVILTRLQVEGADHEGERHEQHERRHDDALAISHQPLVRGVVPALELGAKNRR